MNILETIVAQKKIEIARLPASEVTPGRMRDLAAQHGLRRDFIAALLTQQSGEVSLIAEVKKASPSAGVICADFDPVRIAREYVAAGASCISVLTDEKFFQGSLSYLRQIQGAVKVPILRKDFIIDPRQIVESIEFGADAILLIAAILSDAQLNEYIGLAEAAGLAPLVEVHDDAELDRALAAGALLIGVNNRDLKTFKVDLATTERLAKRLREAPVGARKLLVAESGIQTRNDVERLARCGANAILVGESLLRHGSITEKINELLGCCARVSKS